MHHIHNVVNKRLGKPTMSYDDALIAYYAHYRSGDLVSILNDKLQDKFTYLAFVSGLIALIYFCIQINSLHIYIIIVITYEIAIYSSNHYCSYRL